MKALFLFFLLSLPIYSSVNLNDDPAEDVHPANYQYNNGQWFDGQKFVKKTMYSVDGVWSDKIPASIDSVLDLQNRFIIPPLSEAHTHMLDGFGDFKQLIKDYLKSGVFYVKNPNNIKPFTENIRPEVNGTGTVDAVFANGGLTSNGGHPEILYEEEISQHMDFLANEPKGWFKNKSYFNIDSEADFNQQWDLIKQGKPDFIKVMIANSEDVGKTPPASRFPFRKGLNPKLIPIIVKKAHNEGFRVTAHVETRADFIVAVNAGVDEINHTPGFYLFSKEELDRYRLTDKDAKQAAEKGIYVVTAIYSRNLTKDPELMPLVAETQAYNLALLHKNGVKIAIGSDHAQTPIDEVKALQELNIFDNLTILKMWCENSPQTIFPERKLGYLKGGYEASFLALDGNPITDLSNIFDIAIVFKQGHTIELD